MAEYHSDFWLIMGTSGPVVMLTHVVGAARAGRPLPGMTAKSAGDWVRDGLVRTRVSFKEFRRRTRELTKAQRARL